MRSVRQQRRARLKNNEARSQQACISKGLLVHVSDIGSRIFATVEQVVAHVAHEPEQVLCFAFILATRIVGPAYRGGCNEDLFTWRVVQQVGSNLGKVIIHRGLQHRAYRVSELLPIRQCTVEGAFLYETSPLQCSFELRKLAKEGEDQGFIASNGWDCDQGNAILGSIAAPALFTTT